MLEHLIAVMAQPDEHLYVWRNGELFIRRAPETESSESSRREVEEARREAEEKIAA